MILARTKLKLAAISLIIFGVVLFVLINFTSVSNLQAVSFNGREIKDFDSDFGLSQALPILKQPLDSLSEALLARDDIARVDIDYAFPNRLEIVTNRFDPVCFALDMKTGRLVGLTAEGRVVPLDPDQSDWELPIITSITTGKLYQYTSDVRVRLIVENLISLKQEQRDLFRLITEIDLAQADHVRLSISGLPYRLRAHAAELDEQMIGFLQFLEKYHPALDDTRELDLRFDDLIIQVRKGR